MSRNDKGIRIFDYHRFAEPSKEFIRQNTNKIVVENHLEIEFICKKGVLKEDIELSVLFRYGTNPSLVYIILILESCDTHKP